MGHIRNRGSSLVCALIFSAFGTLGGCGSDDSDSGPSSVDACKDTISTLCDKYFSCYTQEQLDQAVSVIGVNSADCRTKLGVDCTEDKTKCDAGETYHSEKAQACVDALSDYSCDDVMGLDDGTTPWPSACEQSCTRD